MSSDRPYPPYVHDAAARRRWNLCVTVAAKSLDEPQHTANVWQATRILYWSDLPADLTPGLSTAHAQDVEQTEKRDGSGPAR
jgi:hypothetical protein